MLLLRRATEIGRKSPCVTRKHTNRKKMTGTITKFSFTKSGTPVTCQGKKDQQIEEMVNDVGNEALPHYIHLRLRMSFKNNTNYLE